MVSARAAGGLLALIATSYDAVIVGGGHNGLVAEREDEVGTWGVETGVPRVVLCGAGARRGGGVSGIPGRNAAMAVLGGA